MKDLPLQGWGKIGKFLRPTINKKIGMIFLFFLLVAGANVFVVQKMQKHLHAAASMVHVSDMERRINHTNKIVYALMGVDALLLITGLLAIRRRMVVPLIRISSAAELLARGERFVHVDCKYFDEIGDLARIFNYMVEEIRKLEDLKDSFVNTVSHELKTPLSTMKLIVENLGDGIGGSLTKSQGEMVLRLKRSIAQLTRITENTLKLSRLESGREELVRTRIDIDRIISDTIETFRPKAAVRQISLHGNIAENQVPVEGDEVMITETLYNLVDNALRYARSDIAIRAAANEDGSMTISVIDNGPGIPDEKLEHIFNKYEQIRRRQEYGGYKGSGLGLSICKKIVDLHHGKIWAGKPGGDGMAFHFTLPGRHDSNRERREKHAA